MAWKRQILVVADVTATSGEVIDELASRAAQGPAAFTLLVPTPRFSGARRAAEARLAEAMHVLRERGLEVDGLLGDGDPMVAVAEAWDPKRYDEIIVSTLPVSISKWLYADLPHRIERHTGAVVTHIVSQPPVQAPRTVRVQETERRGVLAPLSVLGWGARSTERHS